MQKLLDLTNKGFIAQLHLNQEILLITGKEKKRSVEKE